MTESVRAPLRVRRALGRLRRRVTLRGIDWTGLLPRQRFVSLAYRFVLGRRPDSSGKDTFGRRLADGLTRGAMLDELRDSTEARNRAFASEVASLHHGRKAFVRSLPRAARILDLGGTDLSDERGALVTLGYPYPFESLTIVDLPPDERHESYASDEVAHLVNTESGPVSYRYHSMSDLDGITDASIDLVYSGQTFEHVSPLDGHRVLDEAHRVLRPGGHLCLDTPNRAVTALQLRESDSQFIDPDHEIEYTHGQMLDLFAQHGFEVIRSHGIGLMSHSVTADHFQSEELLRNHGLYDDIEQCYLLAYVCRVA